MWSLSASSLVKLATNWSSLSKIISFDRPWSFHMLARYSRANPVTKSFVWVEIAWICFVNQSTTTSITSFSCACGSGLIMSTEITSQGQFGGIIGISLPGGNWQGIFVYWHLSYLRMRFSTICIIFGYQKTHWIRSCVFHFPECLVMGLVWYWWTISFLNFSFGT